MISIVLKLIAGMAVMFLVSPETLDQPQTYWNLFGSFFLFLFFFFSLLGYGELIEKNLSGRNFLRTLSGLDQFTLRLAFGSVFLATLAGALSLITVSTPVYGAFLLLGFVAFDFSSLNFLRFQKSDSKLIWLLGCVLGLSVFLRLIESSTLQRQGDPFIVYLTANRSLVDHQGFSEFVNTPIFFMSSAWENLYLWGNVFFAKGPHLGLASGQRFAQWCVSGVAHLGTIGMSYLLTKELITRTLVKDRTTADPSLTQKIKCFALAAAVSATTIERLRWMQNIGKNDLGIVLWVMLGVYLILVSQKKLIHLLAGVALGAAVIGKPSSASIAPVVAILLIVLRAPLLNWAMITLGGFLGALPLLIRNFVYAHNPLFPWLSNLFARFGADKTFGPSQAQTFLDARSFVHPHISPLYFYEPFLQQPLSFLLIPVVLFFIAKKKYREPTALLFWFLVANFVHIVFFALTVRTTTEIRYFAPGLMILVVSAIAGLGIILLESQIREKLKLGGTWLLGIVVIAQSNLPLFTLKQITSYKYQPGNARILEHAAGKAKDWLRKNHPTEGTVTLQDHEIYYMLGDHYVELSYDRPLDLDLNVIYKASPQPDYAAMIQVMRNHQFRFLMDSRAVMDWGGMKIEDDVAKYLSQFPTAIVYQDDEVKIYDFNLLQK